MWDMFNRYPYINLTDRNLDLLTKAIREMQEEVKNFVSINAVKYANPIQWNINRQYEKNTIVIDPLTGTAFISVQPVPNGVALTRQEYWTPVFDLSQFVTKAASNFANTYERDITTTATMPTGAGDWIVWDSTLYVALNAIHAGDAYVVNGNIKRMTVEDFYDLLMQGIHNLDEELDTEIRNRTEADTTIRNALNEEIAARQSAVVDLTAALSTLSDSVTTRINSEVAAREAQDTALSGRIDAEIAARELQDTALSGRIDAEIAARELQDTALSARIDAVKDVYHKFFDNKKILIIGDSNSAEGEGIYNWVSVFRETFPTADITNHSFNGATLTGSGTAGQARWYGQDAPTGFDYIIIMLGTNDCYHQAGIDSLFYDNKSLDSFTGCLSYLAEKHVSKNPSAKVFYISPIKNTQMSGESVTRLNILDVYRTHIWRACCLYSWTFIDAGHCAPNLNPLTYSQYIPDGVHMSAQYAPIFADYVMRKMVSMGDSGHGSFTSVVDLTSVLNTVAYPNSSLFAKYKSDGSSELELTVPNVSIGAGLGIVLTSSLPQWCSAYGTVQGICRTDDVSLGLQQCQIVNSQIAIFPTVTVTTTLHATFNINSPKSLYQLPFIF